MPLSLIAAPPALPGPDNLQREALRHIPVVVLFSQSGCHWCEQARAHLAPMARSDGAETVALFRQIDLDSDAPMIDFHGHSTTQRGFARSAEVRFTPTVVVYGPDGAVLADPIVGMRLPDFYGLYVEQAIAQARERLSATPR